MSTPRPASRLRLICEALEDRSLLAASLLANLNPGSYSPDHLLVHFKPDAVPVSLLGTTITSALSLVPGLYEVQLPAGITVDQALSAYSNDPHVLSVQPDYLVQVEALPNDPLLNQQWAFSGTNSVSTINPAPAWDRTTGSGRTIVAVIDTGVDITHPDLASNIWKNTRELAGNGIDDDGNGFIDDYNGYNFVANTGDPTDDNGHGTHVAGIIGATGNNGIGVTGVNWNVKIMALKFLDSRGIGSTSNALRALNYAVQMGATISNNSWTSPAYDYALEAGIRNAGLAGHIYVAAAGNLGQNLAVNKLYPAAFALDNVVAVAGLDSSNNLASWSNYGSNVAIAAPGAGIYSTLPGKNYGYMSGTSMATPFVTGALALVRDYNPTWTAQQVIQRVLTTADVLPSLTGKIRGGKLNLGAAIGQDTPPPPPPPQDTTGAQVIGLMTLINNGKLTGLRVTFNEAVQPASFDVSKVRSLAGPNGALTPTSIRAVAGSTTQFDVLFVEQTRTGPYTLTLDTGILDQAGNQLNQNGNATNGETPADQYTGTVSFLATNTFPATGLPSLVKDYSVNTYSLNVPNNMAIGAVRVQINVSHGWMSDMVIKLRSPSGTEVLLANRRGSGGKGYNNTIFDDTAAKALIQGGGLFQGSFRPEAPLAAFKGSSTGGIWTLVIEDKARGDAGTLLGWSLTFDASSGASSVSSAPSRLSSLAAELSKLVTTQPANASLTSLSQAQSISFAFAHTQLAQGIHASTTIRPADNIVIKKQQQQLLKAWQEELATALTRFRATI